MEKADRDYKGEYNILQKKHSLPEFQKLVEDFDIEKFLEKESSILIRDIRRGMVEKFIGYSHFFENMLNPTSPSMLLFAILKKISSEDRDKVKEIHKKLTILQVRAMKVDAVYSEKAEIKFIKDCFDKFSKT